MNFVLLNGRITAASEPVLAAANRSYRYGDGLFETMKMVNGKIRLAPFHFDRLSAGLSVLKYEIPPFFTPAKLEEEILLLSQKNKCESLSRIRLSVSRGNGGLYDGDRTLQYLAECWPLEGPVNQLNENGLCIDIYTGARKNCDAFSNLKSANFLPYSMAAIHARENKLNDCLVLNTYGRICDSTVANLFWIRDQKISTPSLSEGCIAGVMRRHLTGMLRSEGYDVQETEATVENVENADEIFLTNATHGIRWVRQFRNKKYGKTITTEIYNKLIKTISS